jgi:hypothetical protein
MKHIKYKKDLPLLSLLNKSIHISFDINDTLIGAALIKANIKPKFDLSEGYYYDAPINGWNQYNKIENFIDILKNNNFTMTLINSGNKMGVELINQDDTYLLSKNDENLNYYTGGNSGNGWDTPKLYNILNDMYSNFAKVSKIFYKWQGAVKNGDSLKSSMLGCQKELINHGFIGNSFY